MCQLSIDLDFPGRLPLFIVSDNVDFTDKEKKNRFLNAANYISGCKAVSYCHGYYIINSRMGNEFASLPELDCFWRSAVC